MLKLECIKWEGFIAKNGYGYGYDKITKKMRLAHRLVFEKNNKIRLNRSEVVMHICDNPSCVNPQHLRKGSQIENLKDCRDKRRHMHGDKHTSAKLTIKKALQIRRMYETGKFTETEISEIFGVNQPTIHDVIKRKTWKEEPIEKCKHPKEKVGIFWSNHPGLSEKVWKCECGAKVQPKEFEEI